MADRPLDLGRSASGYCRRSRRPFEEQRRDKRPQRVGNEGFSRPPRLAPCRRPQTVGSSASSPFPSSLRPRAVILKRDDAGGGAQAVECLVGGDPRQPDGERLAVREVAEPGVGPKDIGPCGTFSASASSRRRLQARRDRRRLWRWVDQLEGKGGPGSTASAALVRAMASSCPEVKARERFPRPRREEGRRSGCMWGL